MMRERYVVGLVGGVASGKSAVAELFRKCGAAAVDADAIAHEVVDRPEVRDEIVRTWGAEVVTGGRIDRRKLAARAFRTSEDVRRLDAIVHPAVGQELVRRVQAARGVVVVEAALLLETGADALCDRVVFVDAPKAERERRAAARDWEPGELERRERHQWPDERKRSRSHHVIRNDGSLTETERQVRELYDRFVQSLYE